MTPWRPEHWGVADSRCLGRRGVGNLRCPEHLGFVFLLFFKLQANLPSSEIPGICESLVSRTLGSCFFTAHCFFQTSSYYYSFKSNNLSKVIMHLLFTIQILLVHVFKNFPYFIILFWLPKSQTPGNRFKTLINLLKMKMALWYI